MCKRHNYRNALLQFGISQSVLFMATHFFFSFCYYRSARLCTLLLPNKNYVLKKKIYYFYLKCDDFVYLGYFVINIIEVIKFNRDFEVISCPNANKLFLYETSFSFF